jgi:pSer/pThr/pTyr-binding forkhead associated (FHA) protein
MPEIVVKFDNKVVERIVTEKDRVSIGRTSDNDIVLDNRGVSRKHARIEFNSGDAVVIDNESLNGTFVNNRKVNEESLRDNDVITIGKFNLEYHASHGSSEKLSDHDGTMILNTKKQRELVETDREDKKITRRTGCSVLIDIDSKDRSEHPLDKDIITIGKSKYVNIRCRGWLVAGIQAKVVREGNSLTLYNVGRRDKTRVNGESVERHDLKNGDIVQVGKTAFRFVEAGS